MMSIYVNVASAAPPWDPDTPQVNIGGATLFESFFQGPGSTNDYIDVNDDGLYGYNAGGPPYVDQLAKDWTNFNSAPPSTHWIVNYRGIGSGGGLGELLTFQAVQVATNQTWFPIDTWNSQGGSIKGGRNYGILPVSVTSGLGLTNRTAYSDEGSTLWSGPYANTSGIGVKPQGIDIGVMDVPTKWFVKAGSDNQAAWSRKPTAGGYGRYAVKSWDTGYKNTLQSLSITLTENPDGSGGSETVTLNTNTGSPDTKTVFDTEIAYVPMEVVCNRGVNKHEWTTSELQHLFLTGRTKEGENLVAATRYSGSGTRNGSMNSIGIDPSWARGDNLGSKIKDSNVAMLGEDHQASNLGSSGIMRLVVSYNRLAVGYNGLENSVTNIEAGKALFEHCSVKKDIAGGTAYVFPTIDTVLDNADVNSGWQIGGNETFATRGDPEGTAHNPTQGAPSLGGNGNPQMDNAQAALYIRNILESIAAFEGAPGAEESYFMPGELLATKFFLTAALDALPGATDGTNWTANGNLNQTLQDFTRANHMLAVSPPHAWDAKGNWVPLRASGTYDDGGTQDYKVKTWNGSSYDDHTVAGKSQINTRNLVQGDFNNDGARNSTDIAKMMECINSGNILEWAADQTGGGNLATLVMPHIIGDFNADGNFNAADVRYFADGLAVGSNLDRNGAFLAVDNATTGGNFFGTTLANGTYAAGYSRADLAGSDPTAVLLGATPGAAPNGADGMIDGYDISYLQRVLNGWLGADALGITDTTDDGTAGWDWDNLNEAVFTDLSCDLNGDRIISQADVDLLVNGILDTEYGDINLDRVIDGADLSLLAGNWDSTDAWWGTGDLNGDGLVDGADLSLLAGNWDFAGAPGQAPEPTTILLLSVGGFAALARRRRRQGRRA
jgi:hypothetical protein